MAEIFFKVSGRDKDLAGQSLVSSGRKFLLALQKKGAYKTTDARRKTRQDRGASPPADKVWQPGCPPRSSSEERRP
ncbi:MAG: hypothetical protein C4531_15785 [Desulfurivibrio sp.]|nr:MAG: hypothetical protein C4531_15785 [Desulfurivibrio sp.]